MKNVPAVVPIVVALLVLCVLIPALTLIQAMGELP